MRKEHSAAKFSERDSLRMTLDMTRSKPQISVLPPTFEHHHDGFGVQCPRPRISWRFSNPSGEIHNWTQTAHEVEIFSEDGEPSQIFVKESISSVLEPWPSPQPLRSRARRLVRVRCHGRSSSTDGDEYCATQWSPWSTLEIALLDKAEWTAHMITTSQNWPLSPDGSARPLCFSKTFSLPSNRGAVVRARLYATSHGVYDANINGLKVGDHCLSPGFQSYHKRLHYQTFDVKDLLITSGSNKIEIEVAAGWFASSLTWFRRRFIYGDKLGVMAQLEVHFSDSSNAFTVSTDRSWNASTTAIISSDLYDGEIHDQRLNASRSPGGANLIATTQDSTNVMCELVSPEAPPVRVVERIQPKDIRRSRSGEAIIVDFGQNLAGRICVRRAKKLRGSFITFCHAEVIQDGEIVRRTLRTAKAKDVLICDGLEILDWHPTHTYHGFRYVEITGWDPDDLDCPLTKSSIVAEVLHTDMLRTGWFSCSDKDINRLHQNSLWGMKSNFLSVPTECPSRDERLGWTGDLNMFAPTANFLYDTSGLLRHWLDDLYLDQMDESIYWRQGVVPLFIPNCMLKQSDDGRGWDGGQGWGPMPNAVWGDASIMVPWELYQTTGDLHILSRQYDSMVQFLEHGVVRGVDGLWNPEEWQFGDWLDPRAPQNDSGRGTTNGTYVADCFLVASTRIVAEVAGLVAKATDSSRFQDTALCLVRSWRNKYLTPAGLVAPDTATALALALLFDLIPDSNNGLLRKQAASRLSQIIRFNDFKITTGFVGTAFLHHALSKIGGVDLGYAMLFQKECPSYLYPVTMGATTTWERWDSMLPDGSVNPGSMTSFNHHAFGSIAHWLHTDVGGLQPIEPGWKVFRVKPRPNKELTWVDAKFESRYGRIELEWRLEGDSFSMFLQVPPNSSAVVNMPGHDIRGSEESECKERKVGSGRYTFECRFTQPGWPIKAMLPPWGRADF